MTYADKGMITPEDLPHFVTGQHDRPRVGSLAFLRSNNSILTCLFYLWLYLFEKMFGLWLYFGFFIKWQECYFSVSIFVLFNTKEEI